MLGGGSATYKNNRLAFKFAAFDWIFKSLYCVGNDKQVHLFSILHYFTGLLHSLFTLPQLNLSLLRETISCFESFLWFHSVAFWGREQANSLLSKACCSSPFIFHPFIPFPLLPHLTPLVLLYHPRSSWKVKFFSTAFWEKKDKTGPTFPSHRYSPGVTPPPPATVEQIGKQ